MKNVKNVIFSISSIVCDFCVPFFVTVSWLLASAALRRVNHAGDPIRYFVNMLNLIFLISTRANNQGKRLVLTYFIQSLYGIIQISSIGRVEKPLRQHNDRHHQNMCCKFMMRWAQWSSFSDPQWSLHPQPSASHAQHSSSAVLHFPLFIHVLIILFTQKTCQDLCMYQTLSFPPALIFTQINLILTLIRLCFERSSLTRGITEL